MASLFDKNCGDNKGGSNKNSNLNPAQALVIGGLISGALSVESVLMDKDQTVEIVLSGSLKQKTKTQLDQILDQLGTMKFDEVVKAFLERLEE